MAEDFGLREVAHACLNLQILALGWELSTDFNYVRNIKLPDSVYGPHNCIDFNTPVHVTDLKEKSPHLIGIFAELHGSPNISMFLKTNVLSSLKVLIFFRDGVLDEEVAGALAINCPALRLLEIDYHELYHWHATLNALLKRLFVLILNVRCEGSRLRSLPNCCFPEGCKLRVLTVYGDCSSRFLLWLEELLNIIDVCLPELFLLNVVFRSHSIDDDLLCEQAKRRRDNLKYHFNQKSVDLTFMKND